MPKHTRTVWSKLHTCTANTLRIANEQSLTRKRDYNPQQSSHRATLPVTPPPLFSVSKAAGLSKLVFLGLPFGSYERFSSPAFQSLHPADSFLPAHSCDKLDKWQRLTERMCSRQRKFQDEIQARGNTLKPERVRCPSPGCECTYEMYGSAPANFVECVTILQDRIKREHPGHTSEVLSVNEFHKVRR